MKKLSLLILALCLSAHADDVKVDEHIASQIHQINQMEMQMGLLARSKGTTAEVRDFGDRIYKDHAAAEKQLMDIAGDMKLKLSRPVAQNAVERKQQADTAALMKKLDSTSGTDFDQAFLKGMVAGHREVISMIGGEQDKLAPSKLKDFVSNTLVPNLHQHEDIAMAIENKSYA